MLVSIFGQTNFIDILIVILLCRICYIAAKTGLNIEIFKFFGVVFTIFISLHYYANLSDMIQRKFFYEQMPLMFFDFLIFILLILVGCLLFATIRSFFYKFIKLETMPVINNFGGLILGILRGYFAVGLLVFSLSISNVSYLSSSVKHSYLGSRAFLISPNTYYWIWSNIYSKFSTKEKPNPVINEVIDMFNRR